MNQTRPISLLICALGGEGGGVLTEWLIEIARHSGHAAQSTSIPGVAQRTGATTYYVEVFPQPLAELAGRRPVFSLNPVPGALDAIVSSELLETARQIGAGLVSPERTLLISSTGRTLTTQERSVPGDGRIDSAALLPLLREHSREHHLLDMAGMAQRSGTVVSAVMLGAVAGSGIFPFAREACEAVIRQSGDTPMTRASLAGFALAFDQVHASRQQARELSALLDTDLPEGRAAPVALPAEVARRFAPAVHDLLALGHARLLDYQDAAYADLYLQRLEQVQTAEQAADPAGAHQFAATREMARWLALWMAYDDIVRVADLKSRASRWQRVRSEVKPGADDLLLVHDFFKPGVPEFAALLPPALAQRLLAWEDRRTAHGKAPWALPIRVGTHSVLGMLALRSLSAMKFLRLRSSRHAREQALIGQWLQGVLTGLSEDWALGHETALCGRLIKGYGSTNERGKERLLHVLQHLAGGHTAQSPAARAQAIAAVRAAALADDSGQTFDQALLRHGAPAREIRAQPIRWVKRRPGPELAAANSGKP